jgi:hypothetical protein
MATRKKSKSSKTTAGAARKGKIGRPRQPGPIARWWYGLDEPARRRVRARAAWLILLLASIGPAIWGLRQMRREVLAGPLVTRDFEVRVESAPRWMPAEVVAQLESAFTPRQMTFHDEHLTQRIHELARANPWTRKVIRVEKRRRRTREAGLVGVRADWREPLAKIITLDSRGERVAWYVDAQGVVLPFRQVPTRVRPGSGPEGRNVYLTETSPRRYDPQVRSLPYIRIYNVAGQPPEVGQPWPGQDVQDALRLANLIMTLDWWNLGYHWQIDLANYSRKRELTMTVIDQAGRETFIEFGHFPRIKGDWKLTPEKKMRNLTEIYRSRDGQLTSLGRIDLRFQAPDVR